MSLHAANLDKSLRLQKVLNVLAQGGWHGTREIVHAADICACNSIISELRANKIRIESRCVTRGRWEYRLAPRAMPTEQMSLGVAA